MSTGTTNLRPTGVSHNPYAALAETRLPTRPGRVFAGAAGIVGGIFLTSWAHLTWKEKRSLDPSRPGSLSGWKHRYTQASTPLNYQGVDESAKLRHDVDDRSKNGAGPLVENNRDQHLLTGLHVGDIKRDPNGGPMHPTPQRAHGTIEGLAYTKLARPFTMSKQRDQNEGHNGSSA